MVIGLEQHRDYSKEFYSLSHVELKLVGLIDNLLRAKIMSEDIKLTRMRSIFYVYNSKTFHDVIAYNGD